MDREVEDIEYGGMTRKPPTRAAAGAGSDPGWSASHTAAAWTAALLAAVVAALAACSPSGAADGGHLKLATTTSMYHIGLWDVLEPVFEREHGVDLLVLTGGTGQAIEAGRRGDVDVLTLHDEARELDFVEEGPRPATPPDCL